MRVNRDELLQAFRAERGPSADAVDRVHERLRALGPPQRRSAVIELAPPQRLRRPIRIVAAVAAIAAALLLGWWIRGASQTAAPARHGSLASDRAVPDARREATHAPTERDHAVPTPPPAVPELPADVHDAPAPASADLEVRPVGPLPNEGATPGTTRQPTPAKRTRNKRQPKAEAGPAAPADPSLAAEVRMVQRARSALSSGKPREARQILADYRRTFARPTLAEEAAAVDTMAGCRLGRGDARAFTRRFPKSLFRAQVNAACNKPSAE